MNDGIKMKTRLTYKQAADKIKEFGLHHAIQDLPHSTLTVEAFKMGIEACKKQEPVRLLDSYIDELDCGDNVDIPAKECPVCGYIDVCDFEDVYDRKYEYCPMCGQKLDREGDREC